MALPEFVALATTADMGATGPTTYVVTLPTYTAGDLVLVQAALFNANGQSNNTLVATGWTQADNASAGTAGNHRQILMYRIMDGTEGTTVTFSFGGSVTNFIRVAARAGNWRGVSSGTVFDGANVSAAQLAFTASASVGPKSTTPANDLLLAFFQWDTGFGSGTTPNFAPSTDGVVERWDSGGNIGFPYGDTCEELAASAPGSYTIAGNWSENGFGYGVLVALQSGAVTSAVKTALGVSRGSVKTISGVPIASVKTIAGLA